MNRKALLILNPGEIGDENYAKGVFVDSVLYTRFFKMPQGGYWSDSELQILTRPTVLELREAVKTLQGFDYTFVAFSGHGWYSGPDRETILTLQKGHEIYASELRQGATKRTLVLDCCRKVYNESLQERTMKSASVVVLNASATIRRTPDAMRCREKFFTDVRAISSGVTQLNGCAIEEKAGDDEQLGGRYTSSLISGASKWAEQQATNIYLPIPASQSVVSAHDIAAVDTVRRSGGTQNPKIEKDRSGPYAPLAVFA